jgi:nigerose phosphorylase
MRNWIIEENGYEYQVKDNYDDKAKYDEQTNNHRVVAPAEIVKNDKLVSDNNKDAHNYNAPYDNNVNHDKKVNYADTTNHDKIISQGNKYLVGNGYLGVRGTLPEYEREEFPAINLAGIYDQVGNGWREPLNAPNGLYTRIKYDGELYALPIKNPYSHNIKLDYRHGIFSRNTTWNTSKGIIRIEGKHFASLSEKHLIVMQYNITVQNDGEIELNTGIDGDVWDINGPHYDDIALSSTEESLVVVGTTHEKKKQVVVCETQYYEIKNSVNCSEQIISKDKKIIRNIKFTARAGVTYQFVKYVSIYTSEDCNNYKEKAMELALNAKSIGYETLLNEHEKEWAKKWNISEVIIEGDDDAMEALNYSLYHLHCIAPRHAEGLSIAARGLSGQTYKGAVFWDTEMFMLDFFLFTEPSVAKTLLKYRVDTLKGALEKAKEYGYDGAFYAWESQEGGFDACSDYNVTDVFTGRPMRTYFKDKQIHISAAVVYGIMRYVDFTGKNDLLKEGGYEVILECAKFYYSLLVKKVCSNQYELWDVIGPDEYHERVNNNAYTNRMAKYAFDSAIDILESIKDSTGEPDIYHKLSCRFDLKDLDEKFKDASQKLFVPAPDAKTGIIEQFDGYEGLEEVSLKDLKCRLLNEKEYWGGAYGIATHTKIIKQADVITMMNLFSLDYTTEELTKNWGYYEPRTEHGSSLSACMYSMVACKCNMADIAYPFFLKSAKADLTEGGKQWAGLIYIGGTHPAASGGAYMTAIEGFAGIHIENGELRAKPRLPGSFHKLQFKMYFKGDLYEIIVTKEDAFIKKIEG